jgi:hypothetical protein
VDGDEEPQSGEPAVRPLDRSPAAGAADVRETSDTPAVRRPVVLAASAVAAPMPQVQPIDGLATLPPLCERVPARRRGKLPRVQRLELCARYLPDAVRERERAGARARVWDAAAAGELPALAAGGDAGAAGDRAPAGLADEAPGGVRNAEPVELTAGVA